MKYNIALVQPGDIISNNVILPLAIGILWQNAVGHADINNKWNLTNIVYTKDDIATTADQLAQCDVVCFSSYLWNYEYNFELATAIKQRNKTCFIVVGGPHIHLATENFWANYGHCTDLVIVGEGDSGFVQLLKQWPNIDVTTINGAWTSTYSAGEAPRITNLEELPSPYLNGFYDSIVAKELALGRNIQAVIQTNRGCPYHCTFCEEGKDYKNKMYFYDYDQIKKEIEWCGKNQVEFLSIADDNWGIAHKDVELMEHICLTKLKYGYPRILDATYAKNAEDRVIAMARLDKQYDTNLIRGVTAALQSTNPTALTAIKRFNLVPAKRREFVRELQSLDIPIYAELIWPLPYETYETFAQGLDEILDAGLTNWIGVYPLGLLSSAQLYDDFKNDYVWPQIQVADSNRTTSHFNVGVPMANKWVTHEQVVQGHVLYCWIAVLYYFGFGRIVLDYLKQRGTTPTETVNLFLNYLRTSSSNKFTTINDQLTSYWSNWLANQPYEPFNTFPDEDINFWYPYTHLASYLQIHFDSWLEELRKFLELQNVNNINVLINNTQNSVVRYNPADARFNSLFEFCRYYYWWNRKKGISFIKQSAQNVST